MIRFDSICILNTIKLDDAYGEDAECLPMEKLCKVCLEKSAIEIYVNKIKLTGPEHYY